MSFLCFIKLLVNASMSQIVLTALQTDMHVRDKILVLLDSWQEAFGGPGGKHPQYYWAFDELRVSIICASCLFASFTSLLVL